MLLAMFGEEAETLLQTIRQRHSREASLLGGDVDAQRGERIRELVKIVQESGVGEIEIEDEGMRVSVRRADEPGSAAAPSRVSGVASRGGRRSLPSGTTPSGRSASSRRWSASSTARPQPGAPPFVEVGDVVAVGQTLCLLEAMKLFNELKADARRPRAGDPRRERRSRSSSARCSSSSSRSTPRRSSEADVLPRPRREPGRDRRPRDPRAARARHRGGRRLLDRRPRRAARPPRRPGRLHRAAAGRRELPADPERRSRPPRRPAARRCTPATASSPRTPPSRGRARRTTSSSSARRPR